MDYSVLYEFEEEKEETEPFGSGDYVVLVPAPHHRVQKKWIYHRYRFSHHEDYYLWASDPVPKGFEFLSGCIYDAETVSILTNGETLIKLVEDA